MMITYLKNMGGYKHSQLKGKNYEEIHGLYERQQKRIQDFTPMDSKKEAQKSSKRLKRVAGSSSEQKSSKKPRMINEQEAADSDEEHRQCLKIVLDEDTAINYEALAVKTLIVDWESQLLAEIEAEDIHVYKLTRADGSYRHFKNFARMLEILDRQDLIDLHKIVMQRFQVNGLDGYDLILWGDLRIMFDSSEDDEVWLNQQEWKVLSWKLYETCGVHTLILDGTLVTLNMLVERSLGEDCRVSETSTLSAVSLELVLLVKIEENRLSY
ncbi:hypothetical protein Tco_1057307 [Tanacetum coccineum]|uniref:Uncharacterized protein n=1 Tax=Tanacetum coccineum TaxID=301880 RepID=A0ABQ5H6G0_9ASTR